MILTKNIKIKLCNKMYRYYLNKGYFGKINDEIIINVDDLPICSMFKISVKCDVCDKEKELCYCKYKRNINGFINDISIEEIGKKDNLCFTKRSNNSFEMW